MLELTINKNKNTIKGLRKGVARHKSVMFITENPGLCPATSLSAWHSRQWGWGNKLKREVNFKNSENKEVERDDSAWLSGDPLL